MFSVDMLICRQIEGYPFNRKSEIAGAEEIEVSFEKSENDETDYFAELSEKTLTSSSKET